MHLGTSTLLLVLTGLIGCQQSAVLHPPVAQVRPEKLQIHGDTRIDNYYWLKERQSPEVIAYLEAENNYAEAEMAHRRSLQEKLFNEIKGRIKQTDESVPYRRDDYYYYQRYETGKEYPIYCRKGDAEDAPEEVMVDANQLAQGHEFFSIQGLEISPAQDILAYGIDTQGRRFHTLYFKNLTADRLLDDLIPEVTGNCAWANDNRTIFYTKQHPETLRHYRVYRHVLGTDPAGDTLVYEEADETFEIELSKTKSKKYIMLASSQTLSTEYRYLEAENPLGAFQVIQPREWNHEYYVDHYQDSFYIRTNLEAENFRLVETAVSHPAKENWREVIPHRADVFLDSFELFRDHLVLLERKGGLLQFNIWPWSSGEGHYIDFEEPAYEASLAENWHFDTGLLRYRYSSLITPDSVYDYDMESKEKVLLKQDEVLGGYTLANYESLRLDAKANDGVRVPVSLVYRKAPGNGVTKPLLLYGYGSYGNSSETDFDAARVSLLDRGFVYAIAHIRGGQELGRHWYEDGKLLKKKNTFTDFIACAEYLLEEGYTEPEKLFATGGSAGGLLMGAVINMRPDLFKGVIARVPWVDVVTTMLDPNIPLTTSEFDEWGNPRLSEYYEYMLSYSPYDNVGAKDYPHLLVTTALEDSQVQYWEPAKWVAKLRALRTNDNLLLLKTNMQAGHGGPSGRYKKYRERALHYAFLLDLAGIER